MLDFVKEGNLPLWIWISYFIIVSGTFILGVRYVNNSGYINKTHNGKALGFVLFFTVFTLFYCLNSDFFRYREFAYGEYLFDMAYSDAKDLEAEHYIALLCNGNYELFRIIIWGGAYLVFFLTCKVLKAPTYLSLLIFFLMFNDVASYGRVTLAMSVFLGGLSLIIEKKWYIIGLLIIASSVFFHHSMVVAIAVIPIIFLPETKNRMAQFLLYIAVFVIMYLLITRLMGQTDILQDDEDMRYFGRKMSSSQSKIEQGDYNKNKGLLGMVNDLFSYLLFYVPVIALYFKVNKKTARSIVPQSIFRLYKVIIAIVLLATGFLIIYQSFNVLFYRVLYMSMMPISLLLAYLLSQKVIKKEFIYMILGIGYIHFLGLYLSNIFALL